MSLLFLGPTRLTTGDYERSILLRSAVYSSKGLCCTVQPYIPLLDERDNVRKGFVEPEDHDRLASECAHCGLWLRQCLKWAIPSAGGQANCSTFRVRNINLAANTLRLDPGTTKNLEGRLVVMTRTVRELVTASIYGEKPNDYVFTRKDSRSRLRGAWRSACCRAGLGKMLSPSAEERSPTRSDTLESVHATGNAHH